MMIPVFLILLGDSIGSLLPEVPTMDPEVFWVMVGSLATLMTLVFVVSEYRVTSEKQDELRFEEARPFVLVSYSTDEDQRLLVTITNSGNLPALDVEFEVKDETDLGNHYLLSRVPIIRDGIKFIGPGDSLSYAVIPSSKWPKVASISVTYETFRGSGRVVCITPKYQLDPDPLRIKMAEEIAGIYLGLGRNPNVLASDDVKKAIAVLKESGIDTDTLEGWREYSNF